MKVIDVEWFERLLRKEKQIAEQFKEIGYAAYYGLGEQWFKIYRNTVSNSGLK